MIVQTMLEVEQDDEGRRHAKRLKAEIVKDRKGETLQGNIQAHIHTGSHIQTDSFSSYRSVSRLGYRHSSVNHSRKEWVKGKGANKVTTNTLEGTHGAIKGRARKMNIFTHEPSSSPQFPSKLNELVCRFNHRGGGRDFFVHFLNLVVAAYAL